MPFALYVVSACTCLRDHQMAAAAAETAVGGKRKREHDDDDDDDDGTSHAVESADTKMTVAVASAASGASPSAKPGLTQFMTGLLSTYYISVVVVLDEDCNCPSLWLFLNTAVWDAVARIAVGQARTSLLSVAEFHRGAWSNERPCAPVPITAEFTKCRDGVGSYYDGEYRQCTLHNCSEDYSRESKKCTENGSLKMRVFVRAFAQQDMCATFQDVVQGWPHPKPNECVHCGKYMTGGHGRVHAATIELVDLCLALNEHMLDVVVAIVRAYVVESPVANIHAAAGATFSEMSLVKHDWRLYHTREQHDKHCASMFVESDDENLEPYESPSDSQAS